MAEKLKINPRFRDVLIPLTDEQYEKLESSIIAEKQVRDPIVVWRDFIIDGHHRYKIATANKITAFQVVVKDFPDEEAALRWIVENQAARRNLTPEQLSYARGIAYKVEKKSHGGEREASGQNDPLPKTAEKHAEKSGVSEATIKRDEKFAEALDAIPAPLKESILKGEVEASKKDVLALAAAPKEAQTVVARKVRTGQAKNLKGAMAGEVKAKPKPKHGTPVEDSAELFTAASKQLGALSKTVYALGSKHGRHTQFKVADKHLSDLEKLFKQWKEESRA